jgi:arabinan endo-1,5-alpha-L-arabinosidase
MVSDVLRRWLHRVVVFTAAAAVCFSPAYAGTAVSGPVLDTNFPDPDVVSAQGVFHAYATSGNGKHVQRATSRDLVRWSAATRDALPVPGAWVDPAEPRVWAPEVFDNGPGFTLYYTARHRAGGRQCIGVALSSAPQGPFRPVGEGPLICPLEQGGAIDAASYSEDGRRYVVWKNDGNCCGVRTWLHLQSVSADGTRLEGEPVRLLTQDREWEGGVVEAPTLIKRGRQYVLLYSGGPYHTDAYGIGYAVADHLTGPYIKAPAPLMTTDTLSGSVRGPGGQDVVTGADGRDRIVFHGWSADRSRRMMYTADLSFSGGRLTVGAGPASQ